MKILIVQSKIEFAQTLAEIFIQRGDDVFTTEDIGNAINILQREKSNLLVIDLHLPKDAVLELLRDVRERCPDIGVIISYRYPDLSCELEVKKYGADIFLRSPFSKIRVEQALEKLEQTNIRYKQVSRNIQLAPPSIRIPVGFKIILPYLLLAVLLAMGAGYVVSQVALDTVEDRFVNNLIEVGQLTSAWLVEEENNRLETLRLLAFTEGLSESIINNDVETLRDLVLGLAVNNQEEDIEILDSQGVALVSIRHNPEGGRESYEFSRGESLFAEKKFIQQVLNQQVDDQGDKYAELIQAPWGTYFYIAGPIMGDDNQLVGVVLVGRSISTIVSETRDNLLGEESTFAHVSLYDATGQLIGTTLKELDSINLSNESVSEIFLRQIQESQIRSLDVTGISYREILGPWEVRGGQDVGLVGVSLAETFLVRPSQQTQVQIYILASFGLFLIIIIGMLIARRITQPLNRVVSAASEVSQGKWDVTVEPQGRDELTILAHTFNYMISHLKEGEIYRDLLGRTITPQIRDQLRRTLTSGNLKLEGQSSIASIVISDIREFTVISESENPAIIMSWLNQYYGELVPVINKYDGVTNDFVGDSLMAFFGILPVALDPSESAWQACKATIDILKAVKEMNAQREERDIPPLVTGLGVNTGEVAAGSVGTAERVHYSVIGDTVNVAKRLEGLTKEFGETSAIISQDTYETLGDYREQFNLIPLGSHIVEGKSAPIVIYRLLPLVVETPKPFVIDINTADTLSLTDLPGIGPSLAERIIKNRPYTSVEELIDVKGIGAQSLERFHDFIQLDSSKEVQTTEESSSQ